MKKRSVHLILSLVLVALVILFALQNTTIVEVRFLFWGFSLPRSLLIFVMLSIGVIVGWFLRGSHRKTRP